MITVTDGSNQSIIKSFYLYSTNGLAYAMPSSWFNQPMSVNIRRLLYEACYASIIMDLFKISFLFGIKALEPPRLCDHIKLVYLDTISEACCRQFTNRLIQLIGHRLKHYTALKVVVFGLLVTAI